MFRRSKVAVSPGPTVIDPAFSSGCGSSGSHQDRHGQVGPVLLPVHPHRHLARVDPGRARTGVVPHDAFRTPPRRRRRARAPEARTSAPTSMRLPPRLRDELRHVERDRLELGHLGRLRAGLERQLQVVVARHPQERVGRHLAAARAAPVTANGMIRVFAGSSPRRTLRSERASISSRQVATHQGGSRGRTRVSLSLSFN